MGSTMKVFGIENEVDAPEFFGLFHVAVGWTFANLREHLKENAV
jgi:hypothetical protein